MSEKFIDVPMKMRWRQIEENRFELLSTEWDIELFVQRRYGHDSWMVEIDGYAPVQVMSGGPRRRQAALEAASQFVSDWAFTEGGIPGEGAVY